MSTPETGHSHVESRASKIWRRRGALFASIAALAATACAAHVASPAEAAIATKTTATAGKLPGMFLIGTWEQPISSPVGSDPHRGLNSSGVSNNFLYWKSLGINTLVEIPQTGYTAQQYVDWDNAAVKADLWEMRRPYADNPKADLGRYAKKMIAWNLPDEPDKVDPPAHMTTTQIAGFYNADRADGSGRILPVYLSLVGSGLAGGWSLGRCTATSAVACNAKGLATYAQWLSADDYPVDAGRSNPIAMIGKEMDGLWTVGSAGASRMAFIETGHIGNTTRKAVTAAQMKAEIWEAVVHGARGIVYFSDTTPQVCNPQCTTPTTTYDNSWPKVANGGDRGIPAMMKTQNALLKTLQSALAGTINPAGISVSVAAPLDAGWRKTSSGVKYFVVVNTSGSTLKKSFKFNGVGVNKNASVLTERRSVHLNGSGYVTDTFAPYAVHIYQVQ